MMSIAKKIALSQVLKNNPLNPVLVIGSMPFDMDNAVILSSAIDEREVHIPSVWGKDLDKATQNDKAYLIIDGLDLVDETAQIKFAGLLKDRRAGNYKLPKNAQIVLNATDRNKVSNKIQSLCLVWEVK